MFKFSKSKNIDFSNLYQSISTTTHSQTIRKMGAVFNFLKYFSYFLIAVFIFLALFVGINFVNFKNVATLALDGKKNIDQAVYFAKIENFNESTKYSKKAEDNFNLSKNKLQNIKNSFFATHTPILRSELQNIWYLLDTSEALSRALNGGVGLGKELEDLLDSDKKLNFSKFSKEEKGRVLKKIYQSAPDLEKIKKDLGVARSNIEKINPNGILILVKWKILDLKEKVSFADNLLKRSIPLSNLLPIIAGYPEKKSYLLVLQNSDELRPTGGFIGTYGIMETELGDFMRLDTHDIYHMDMPIKDNFKVEPPKPIKKLFVPNWYMRDANWSPDWPTSAEKILWFYKEEDKLLPPKNQINNFSGEFSGVFAINPNFIIDLLNITGPITIKGVEYNKDNFVDVLQYKVERGYEQIGVSSWQRKEVIGDILKELKIRIFDLPASRWPEILDILDDNIAKKDILVYLKDNRLEKIVKEQKWGGELIDGKKNTDYLMIVDANFGAFKTDAVMEKGVIYKVERRPDGLYAKLSLNYAHKGQEDYRTTTYKSYTRIYVPLGSTLIKTSGGETKVEIGKEINKTVFGTYFRVNTGGIGILTFEYKLPKDIGSNGLYDLYIQKQPGKKVESLIVDVVPGYKVKSYNPVGFSADKINNSAVRWETDLSMDKEFLISY